MISLKYLEKKVRSFFLFVTQNVISIDLFEIEICESHVYFVSDYINK